MYTVLSSEDYRETLVNNPTEGYGVFGDIMIKEMKSVN